MKKKTVKRNEKKKKKERILILQLPQVDSITMIISIFDVTFLLIFHYLYRAHYVLFLLIIR